MNTLGEPEKEEKPNYINKEIRKVSEADLKTALKEVKQKNKDIRESYIHPSDIDNGAMSFTEAAGTNMYTCPHTKQACFMSNCLPGHCGNPPKNKVEERVEEKGAEQVGYVNQLFDTLKKYYSDQDKTLAQMLKTIADLESSRDQYALKVLRFYMAEDWLRKNTQTDNLTGKTDAQILDLYKQSLETK